MMNTEQLLAVWKQNTTCIGVVVSIGIGLLMLKKWAAGGVCRSKARLDGKTVIVTGGNTGIGKETARDLAKRGAKVIIACRDMKKGEAAAADIKTDTQNENVLIKKLDLASLKSVRNFASDILKSEQRIHILINNAGVMFCPFQKTEDGYEMQFGTNHLGHFLLTKLLLDRIKDSAPARIVNVSSLAHSFAFSLPLDKINDEKGYSPYNAYFYSKLSNVLFTRELSQRLKGSGVTANSLHPGTVYTELIRHFNVIWRIILTPYLMIVKNATAGAQTTINCAVAEELEGVTGKYFSDCRIKTESKLAQDDRLAKELWELSEKLVVK